MAKNDRSNDGTYSKLIIAAIVVIWVSLVGGNWLGHYMVEKGILGKSQKQEYRAAVKQKPKPWITVDPSQQQELERLQGGSSEPQSSPSPAPLASATPSAAPAPEPIVTASPIAEPAPEVTPVAAATPGIPMPTPALGDQRFHLQFGSFNSTENAQSMVDSLKAIGQDAQVEEIEVGNGKKVFRVRGGDYSEEQARAQRDKLREQNFEAFVVNSQ
jgi:cell division protein FtsN